MIDLDAALAELREKFPQPDRLGPARHCEAPTPRRYPGGAKRERPRKPTAHKPDPAGANHPMHIDPWKAPLTRTLLLTLPGAKESQQQDAEWRVDGEGWNATYYSKRAKLLLQGANLSVPRDALKRNAN